MSAPDLFPIGHLAKSTGVKVPTIRFYEKIGLMQATRRSEADRRLYDAPALKRLAFIRHARDLGFSVDAIRDLIDLAAHPERPCAKANAIAAEQLAEVDAKIASLADLRDELQRIASAGCDGTISECRVIEALSDHGRCAHRDHRGSPTISSK